MVRNKPTPICNIEMTDGSTTIKLSLWREMALEPIEIDDTVTVSHMMVGPHSPLYGVQFQSTSHSTMIVSTKVILVSLSHRNSHNNK